jgi:hypothetical protein
MSNEMLFEDIPQPNPEEDFATRALALLKRAPVMIVFGDKMVAGKIFSVGGDCGGGKGVGLFELKSPHEIGKPRSPLEVLRCHCGIIFKNIEALDVMREWLKRIEEALCDTIEEPQP